MFLILLYNYSEINKLKIQEGCQVSLSSLTEVQAIASGQRHLAPLRHAIDIFHIVQFLNLPNLIHGLYITWVMALISLF